MSSGRRLAQKHLLSHLYLCRWTSLNTATLKFSAIYHSIECNPPSGKFTTISDDRLWQPT
ncbi:hypothetical protein VP01_2735g2 [Puccinia sorghi]|uniref:Uncharacterized protein n=1 Tax=Puccinia sorghi TaxID=27349 RepID=A0A0L6V392_9BASI|nr:hypothetical protein VP01_2735g2 [Puccinia sorghi]